MRVDERAAWLRLALTPGLGAAGAQRLLREFGLPTALFDPQLPRTRLTHVCGAELASRLLGAPAPAQRAAIDAAAAWLDGAPRRFLLTLADADYPAGLFGLADAPPLLYAQGRRELLALPALAIVGSRQATRQGVANAAAFAAQLGRTGLCIVSGLARGIDVAAHRGALDAGAPTIAVLGTGCDRVYPAAHRALAAELGQDGLLLSELPLGSPPVAENFPRRNRLIAALARAVLVVEAALASGSLITARLAGELGRDVLALPGSIHAPLARGCHRLIREGARLVESAQDVLEELGLPAPAAAPLAAVPGAGGLARALLAALGHDPVHVDELARRCGRAAGPTAALLLELELAGAVERLSGNRYQRLPGAGRS
jgi:DNA processing protein